MTLSALWRVARRDLLGRIRGLRLLAICLFLGVATLAAISSLTAGIADELSRRGQTILGGDIQIGIAQREASEAEKAAFRKAGTLSETIRMRAMAIGGKNSDSMLAELKAVDQAYPLYGLKTAKNTYPLNGKLEIEPGQCLTAVFPTNWIYIGPSLASRLNIKSCDSIRFGEANFTIMGIIKNEPDRLGEGFTLGPVAITGLNQIRSTGLIQPGSMYESKYRIKLSPTADPAKVAKALQSQFPSAGWEVTDRSNGAPGTRRFVERMGQFLTLVGLASLVIAGIGVGNGVASYLASKRSSIATLKVNGADSGMIFRIYMMQIFSVAVAAIAMGLIVGSFAPLAIGFAIGDLLPLPPGLNIYPVPLFISAIYGLLIALAFALPPLARARTVPAAGLYRAVVEGRIAPERRLVFAVSGSIAAIIALAVGTARNPLFSLGFIGAAFAILLLLSGVAWAVHRIAAKLPRPKSMLPRLALANLHRPGAQTRALIVALGLGLTLFVTLAAIQTSIRNEIARSVPEKAPSFFVLDIPKDDAPGFTKLVRDAAPDAVINMIPAMRGTIVEYGGQRVTDLAEIPPEAWVLRGDRGITYTASLPNGSTITKGAFWKADYRGAPLVSIEEDVAASLNLDIGDSISVSILGVEMPAQISSFRRVDWDNFGLNYVLVFSPGSIEAAPHNMVATVTVPKSAEAKLAKEIPPAFPSSSLIEVGEVVSQVTNLLSQMAQAIAAAASIAILAGIAVLVGAIAASRQSRIYDSVILKLLGSTRRQILGVQALEYAILSLLLGIVALALGMSAAYFVVVQIFDFKFAPDPMVIAITLVGGAGLTFILGMIGSLPILAARPAEALRSL